MKKKENSNVYEQIMGELMNSYYGSEILDEVLSPDVLGKKNIPIRYRIIAMGFLKNYNLDDLNDELLEHNCQPLYARSSFESTLIYAFSKKMNYPMWKKIANACMNAQSSCKIIQETYNNDLLNEKRITLSGLKRYIEENSFTNDSVYVTKQVTRVLDESIQNLGDDYTEFIKFYSSNIEYFSEVREKTRYYFCKYLYEFILSKIERYKMEVGENVPSKEQLLILLPLKAESALRRRKTKQEDILDVLYNCTISPSAIFEEFNYYFFEYVSIGWVDLLLEDTDSIKDLNSFQIEKISNYIRNDNCNKGKYNDLTDAEVVESYIESIRNDENISAESRKGETAIRKYLRGEIDIDRMSLICFLLFFGTAEANRNRITISEDRINTVLDECGYSMLRKKTNFDRFVLRYIKSKDPVSLLMNEMDLYINNGEPFFTFEVYSNSISNAKELRKSFGM